MFCIFVLHFYQIAGRQIVSHREKLQVNAPGVCVRTVRLLARRWILRWQISRERVYPPNVIFWIDQRQLLKVFQGFARCGVAAKAISDHFRPGLGGPWRLPLQASRHDAVRWL